MTKLNHDKNRRVLIIDDNRSIHDDFRKILSPPTDTAAALEAEEAAAFGGGQAAVQQTQFEIDSAYQGQEGVLLVQKALQARLPYAMAFVDVRMPPGWDGIETTQRIWAIDPDLQIVICTAYSDYSWGEMFEKLGRRDGLLILKKPFDAVEALQLAQALTEKWGLFQEVRRKMEELEIRVEERTLELQQSNTALRTEITEHSRAEQELRCNAALLEAQLNSSIDGIIIVDNNRRTILQNQRFVDIFKIPRHIAEEKSDDERLKWAAGTMKDSDNFLQKVVYLYDHPNEVSNDEIELHDGRILDRYSAPVADKDGKHYGRIWTFRDVTERKKFAANSLRSQKLETVGKLAGGIAHEFNSILTAIIGQSEMMQGELPPGGVLAKCAVEISQAAGRAARLTRQLLAYGRKQLLQPEVLDLNRVITDMENVFRLIMGTDVVTQIVPAGDLRPVKADAGQIEQVIMNMIINAHEAMPNGGRLTLETANVSLQEDSVGRYPELKPGNYAVLAITDTGTGMTDQVKARLFEPFFTTKAVGQGTGLGLSTCYGIIKQSEGHISVYSEAGRGSTFRIYLPHAHQAAAAPSQPPTSPAMPHGTETILLVEDDPALREMAGTLLRKLGYTVWTAANGIEALNLKQQSNVGHIDLLFTDVVMPHMSGKELADRIEALFPHTKILFTSAFTESAIVHQGVLNKGVALLQKPFTPTALALKVRQVLEQPIKR